MTANKRTSGPWSVGATDPDTAEIEIVSEGRPYICLVLPGAVDDRTEANARLIAAAPEYNGAVQAIYAACESNAAPVNLMDALRELDLQGKRISLDADLLIDLFNAHAKATGGAA